MFFRLPKERMFFFSWVVFMFKLQIYFLKSATIHRDNIISSLILRVPSINEVVNIVIWKIEPLNIFGILLISLHHSIPSCHIFVKFKNLLSNRDVLWVKLERQVVEHNMLAGDSNIMDHYWASDRNVQKIDLFVIFIKQRVL